VSTEEIAMETLAQVRRLFPSAKDLECTWWNVVKLGKSLYKEAPGMDMHRPGQVTRWAPFSSLSLSPFLPSSLLSTLSPLSPSPPPSAASPTFSSRAATLFRTTSTAWVRPLPLFLFYFSLPFSFSFSPPRPPHPHALPLPSLLPADRGRDQVRHALRRRDPRAH